MHIFKTTTNMKPTIHVSLHGTKHIYTFKLSLQEKLILWFICCDHHQNKKNNITIDDNIICMYMY